MMVAGGHCLEGGPPTNRLSLSRTSDLLTRYLILCKQVILALLTFRIGGYM